MKRWMVILGVIGALVLMVVLLPQVVEARGGPEGERAATGGFRRATGRNPGNAASDALDPQEEQALQMAIDDEYKALATYLGAMEQFGQVSPFTYIAQAEEQHIAALERLFTRYDLVIPENEWIGETPVFNSVTDACVASAQAEVDNAELYDQLFSMVDNPDLVQVFTNLRNASEYNHLPAFSSCALDG